MIVNLIVKLIVFLFRLVALQVHLPKVLGVLTFAAVVFVLATFEVELARYAAIPGTSDFQPEIDVEIVRIGTGRFEGLCVAASMMGPALETHGEVRRVHQLATAGN